MTDPQFPFASPLYLMAKPAGPACNLACEYCYYLEKNELLGCPRRPTMTDEILERYIRLYMEAQTGPCVQFTWHGGEALLRPLSFYRKAMEIQARYAQGRAVANSIQTNGTLLSDEWCRFFSRNNWLVGISVDGPRHVHDAYRRSHDNRGTFDKVMSSIRMLQRYGVEWNAMAVVNDINVREPEEFYNFFKDAGCRYLQFTPIVERMMPDGHLADSASAGELAPFSVRPDLWGDFLCRIFDLWVRRDVGSVFVQLFDATLANWIGETPGLCTMGRLCGHAGVVEHNGDVYCCDHYVFPDYKLGNLATHTVVEMMNSPRQQAFGAAKLGSLPSQCRKCEFLFACNGECPKNRFALTDDGEPGLNYLCGGYHRFFAHVKPYMDFMAEELRAGRAPANVMSYFV